jgi:universal stress protein E
VRLANDAKYDLVVMGSTGRSGLPRVLLGSTAEAVARRVACSVLTVKREDVLATKSEAEVGEISQWLAEGRRLLDQARYEEALTRFDRCLLRDPYLATAIELAGTAHERLGNQEMAHELRTQAELIRHRLWQQPTDRHVTIV